MPRSSTKVTGVEVIDGMDLGRGKRRRMERSHDGRHESERGHTRSRAMGVLAGPHDASGGGTAEGGVRPEAEAQSMLSEQATRAKGGGEAQSERVTYTGSVRLNGRPKSSITDCNLQLFLERKCSI
jgi:hypothetical protein